jgi:hypothetical protein
MEKQVEILFRTVRAKCHRHKPEKKITSKINEEIWGEVGNIIIINIKEKVVLEIYKKKG